jgi:hypothetical protein
LTERRIPVAVNPTRRGDLHALGYTMNDDQSGDAAPQQKRRRHKRSAQRAPGMESAMAAKDDRNISLKLGGLPTAQAAPDLQDHCDLKKAAAPRGGDAPRGKNLCHQQ